MQSSLPLISVIIPAYNTQDYLPHCLDSLLCQTLPDFELLLIDDGSTDGTAAVADRYAEDDNRVKVIRKENGGVSSARNRGLEVARGEFITFVDSDDTVLPTYLEKLHAALCETNAAIAAANWQESTGKTALDKAVSRRTYTLDEADDMYLLASCCGRMFKRSRMTVHRFAEDIHYGEDTLFSMQNFYGMPDNTLVTLGECLYMYERGRAGSATAQGFRRERLSQMEAYRRIRQAVAGHPRMLRSAEDLEAFALWNLYRLMLEANETANYPAEVRELRAVLRRSRAVFLRGEPLRARVAFRLCMMSHRIAKRMIR